MPVNQYINTRPLYPPVRKYLQSEVYNDPEIMRMMDIIKEKEIAALYLLGAKARNRLHELMDEGKTKTIETVALMDRSFQQRRLLEGQSTENIVSVHATVAAITAKKKGGGKREWLEPF